MGTNFFAEIRTGRFAEVTFTRLHIGKRFAAGGGLVGFCFQAHHTPDGDLDSWAKWKAALRAMRVKVRDEYDRKHDLDEFIAMIEAITPENRRRQFDMVAAQGEQVTTYDDPDRVGDYLCPDGFSFTFANFS